MPYPTIESILARCEEVGDCLEWQGRMQNGVPQVAIGRRENCSHYRTVRRVLTELLRGEPLAPKMRCTVSCNNPRCVAEAHIVLRSHKQIATQAAKRSPNGPMARAKRTHAARTRAGVKLSIEIAREIRASDEPAPVLAARYGVDRSAIKAVRKGLIWREAIRGSSVFAL